MSRVGGGLTPSVMRFTGELQRTNACDVSVIALKDKYSDDDLKDWEKTGISPQTAQTYGPSSFGFAPKMVTLLEASQPKIIHRHGLWNYPSFAVRKIARRFAIPYVVSVHGMMNPGALAVSARRKRVFFALFERRFLHQANCVHVLSAAERDICRQSGCKNPIAVIPNGVPEPVAPPYQPPPWKADSRKTLLFLGRIHPIKGLPALLHAIGQSPQIHSSWRLLIAGWDQGNHADDLAKIVREHDLEDVVEFLGPLFDERKTSALAHCDAFVLPSTSEAQPVAVLEAWSYGKAALITTSCNLPESSDRGASVVVEPNANSLALGLRQLCSMTDEDRTCMGAAAKQWATEHFCWKVQGSKLLSVYNWLLGHGERGDFID